MSNIVHTPGICGGRARIDGTRIAVWLIQAWTDRGLTPTQLVVEYPHLSEEDVLAALDYAKNNQDEIQADLLENMTEAE